jgi:hypothetical protein
MIKQMQSSIGAYIGHRQMNMGKNGGQSQMGSIGGQPPEHTDGSGMGTHGVAVGVSSAMKLAEQTVSSTMLKRSGLSVWPSQDAYPVQNPKCHPGLALALIETPLPSVYLSVSQLGGGGLSACA